jgi:REP element-mobilizing transposase RayT
MILPPVPGWGRRRYDRATFQGEAMPQSLTQLLYHIIFSTKNREPFIDQILRPRLHAYIGGIINENEGKPIITGGVDDHVHIFTYLPATMCIADAIRIIKTNSSKWVHNTDPDRDSFAWQAGYAAFTVSLSVYDDLRRYIEEQETHHKEMSFQDEYRKFLRKHQVEWDERYVWD